MIALIVISILVVFRILVYYQDLKLLKTVTHQERGTPSERNMVVTLLRHDIPAKTIFHDLYLNNQDGTYSQIDLVVATKVGIIVFEIKDYSGWIFGSGNRKQWTQVLSYGKQKYQFYNPVYQNEKHISDLKKQIPQSDTIPFFSLVVFYGDSEIKTLNSIPKDVHIVKHRNTIEVIEQILNNNPPAKYADKMAIVKVLRQAVYNGENSDIRIKHARRIEELLKR